MAVYYILPAECHFSREKVDTEAEAVASHVVGGPSIIYMVDTWIHFYAYC